MITNEFKNKIEEAFNSKITDFKIVSKYVTLITFSNQKYIIKKVSNRTKNIYDYLISQEVKEVVYPMKKIIFQKEIFFVYKYYQEYTYPNEKKIIDLIEVVDKVHKKTGFTVRLNDSNFKQCMKIYKNLDMIFQTLEMIVRECEINDDKEDYDWIILSKYFIFLQTKKIMYQLQRKIHKYIDNKGSLIYGLNHGNLNLNHMVGNKLISFEKSYIGFIVSDYVRLYLSVDDIEGLWFKNIEEKITSYGNDFYKIYFKFMVLYIYIINLRIDSFDKHTFLNCYVQICSKINHFLSLTSNY
jgi:hypothetical protein